MTGREMLYEKNREIDGMNKEFQRQIQILVEDHKKEVDVSIFVKLLFLRKLKIISITAPWGKRYRYEAG